MPIWKINFCSNALWLSELPTCKERQQIREIKVEVHVKGSVDQWISWVPRFPLRYE